MSQVKTNIKISMGLFLIKMELSISFRYQLIDKQNKIIKILLKTWLKQPIFNKTIIIQLIGLDDHRIK